MTALEEITQAIDTLERLKAKSTEGPWEWWNLEGVDQGWTDNGPNLVTVERGPMCADGSQGPREHVISSWGHDANGINVKDADAHLIVTLHRTIDAQLDILKAARDDFEQYGGKPSKFFENDVALARAINGATS